MANRKKSNNELFSSLLYIIIGALFIIFQAQVINWAIYVVGAIFVVSGILDLFKKNWVGGAVSLIIGIAILVLGVKFKDIVLLVLGILIAVKGIVALVDVIKKSRKNALDLIFPILTIVVGAMLAFGNGLGVMIMVVGILMVVDGIIGLVASVKK